PVHQLFQIVERLRKLRPGHVGDELGAGRVLGIEEVAGRALAFFEHALMLVVQERGPMMIEEPGERRGGVEAIIEDGVLVAIQESRTGTLLPDAVTTPMILEL